MTEGWALFGAAFLGATLLPLSSEAALLGALELGLPVGEALGWASCGNALACGLNYGLGWWWGGWARSRLERGRAGRAALAWGSRWGRWSLLGSWLPVVGDPLVVVAGVVRAPVGWFGLVVALRVARYLALAWGWS